VTSNTGVLDSIPGPSTYFPVFLSQTYIWSLIETDIHWAISGFGRLTVTDNVGSSGISKERVIVITFKWTEDIGLDTCSSDGRAPVLVIQGSIPGPATIFPLFLSQAYILPLSQIETDI
jgi:hypothetical protein